MSTFNHTKFQELCKDPKANDRLIRIRIAEVIQKKPWKHDGMIGDPYGIGQDNCSKCNPHACILLSTPCPHPDPVTGSFADIAFELRDKVSKLKYSIALEQLSHKDFTTIDYAHWLEQIPPIAMITAALMAWTEGEGK